MMVLLRALSGLGQLPHDRSALSAWAKRNSIATTNVSVKGGQADAVHLSDLPEDVRLAFLARRAETMGLAMGEHDAAAHVALAAKPVGVQNTAYARAETMMFIAKHRAAGLTNGQIVQRLRAEAAKAGATILAPSCATLDRWSKAIAGLAPINWAPALAPNYQGRTVTAEVSPEAWGEFETLLGLAGKNGTGWPLKEAWQKIENQKAARGWAWPCYRTVLRHWERQDEVRKRALRMGADEAVKSLIQHQPRTVEGLLAMQQVELDGREFKVMVRFRDGRVGCPWVLIYVDRASNRIVSHGVSESENEEAAADVTIRMCETNGIPDLVYTDNGSAFNGRRMAGGLTPLIRRKNTRNPDWEVPGVLKLFGIKLQNTAPNHGQSKVPETVFSIMRRFDNDPAFHGAQRSGPNDTPNANPEPVDIVLFEKALEQYVHDFNTRKGSRAEGIRPGECRNDAFARLSKGRAFRGVQPFQSRAVRMKWHKKTVMQDGRVRFDGGLFGDASTQEAMLKYAGKKVLVGIDPNDYRAPAMVRGWDEKRGQLLLDHLPLYEATRHGDEAGRRKAVAESRRVKKLVEKHKIVDAERKVAALREAIMAAPTPATPLPEKPTVVAIDTRIPFSDKPVNGHEDMLALQARLRANMERKLAAGKAGR